MKQNRLERLKTLQKMGCKWLATNQSGFEWVYSEKPEKRNDAWWSIGDFEASLSPSTGLTSWNDEKPLPIEEAIVLMNEIYK